jgi:DNA-binding transcriptional MerR regulator
MNEEVQNTEQVTGQPTADTNDFTAESQEVKGFTQDEVDRIVKDRLDRERKKVQKQYEGVDLNKYRELMDAEEQTRQEQQKARGEFEKVLSETVSKKDSAIKQLQSELQSIKVDGSLLNAASSNKAINPQQVVSLLQGQVRLNEVGDVEVLDAEGNVRYTDSGVAMKPEELVKEFIDSNPHFKAAGPNGSGPQSSIAQTAKPGALDISQLNMNNPEHRKLYQQHMKSKGIRI